MSKGCYQDKCFVCGKILVTSFLSDEDFPIHEECARELLPKLIRHGLTKMRREVQKSLGGELDRSVADMIEKFKRMKREGTL